MARGGAHVSEKVYAGGQADALVAKLESQGYVAAKQGIHGVSQGEEYVVAAVKRSDVAKIGGVIEDGRVVRNLDKSAYWTRASSMADNGQVLFEDADGLFQLVKVGKRSGRPVALVRVTKNGKSVDVPFYVSSGSAGKTAVPTGKWEVFGGIGGRGRSDWFVKGSMDDIVGHYNCSQLKKIADALDNSVGDLRDTEYMLESMGRASQGGVGNVASARSPLAADLSADDINRGFGAIRELVNNKYGDTFMQAIVPELKNMMGWM